MGEVAREVEATPEMTARMKLTPRSPQTVCPYSGVVADDQDFTHPDDIKAAQKMVQAAAAEDIRAELSRMAAGFNQRQPRNSLIKMSMKVDGPRRTRPRFYRQDLLRELICDHCGRDYGVYAIGLFCPDCGAPNLRLHFAREIELVTAQVALAEGQDAGRSELAYRLLGNAHEDVLTGFEATLKAVYLHAKIAAAPDTATPSAGNDFQNIERGQRRFAEFGIDPYATLDPSELATLKLNIQKRHIIGHNLGIIDAKFAEHSASAKVGQTVRLVGSDIRVFGELAQKVVNVLDDWLAGTGAPIAVEGPVEHRPIDTEEDDVAMSIDRQAAQLHLTPLAFRVGSHITTESATGLPDPIDDRALVAAFADVPLPALRDAIAELGVDGYISTIDLVGGRLPRMHCELELFATFDPLTLGSDPTADAAALARRALELDGTIGIPALHDATEWSVRRFNPALAIMLSKIDDRHVSKTVDGTYPTRHFFLTAEDRVELRRFAGSMPHDG
jgi:hypothetical protein